MGCEGFACFRFLRHEGTHRTPVERTPLHGRGLCSKLSLRVTTYLHPGKAAEVKVNGQVVGVFGELHPLVKEKYEFGESPVIVAEFDLEKLRAMTPSYGIVPVP